MEDDYGDGCYGLIYSLWVRVAVINVRGNQVRIMKVVACMVAVGSHVQHCTHHDLVIIDIKTFLGLDRVICSSWYDHGWCGSYDAGWNASFRVHDIFRRCLTAMEVFISGMKFGFMMDSKLKCTYTGANADLGINISCWLGKSTLKSKAGKKFSFVRFINVFNLERLIGNLCTIWIGRLHLHANPVRFHRDPKIPSASQSLGMDRPAFNSFASVLKSAPPNTKAALDPSHAIVLDESCFMDKDLSGTLMGKIKDITCSNLIMYDNLKRKALRWLTSSTCSFWVLIDTGSSKSKENMIKHMGVLSWFSELVPADDSFVSDERLVWISVEADDPSLPYKKLCVITKPDFSIDYKLKVIVKGRVYWVRIKELDLWSPEFSNYFSDSDSDKDAFVDETLNHDCGNIDLNGDNVNDLDPIMSPNQLRSKEDNIDQPSCESKSNKEGQSYTKSGNNRILNFKTGGSILDVMESVVEIGQTMGYNMEGCLKNIESIIGANAFNHFISSANLVDLPLEGYSFTWAHKSASKMSKLDRFLVSEAVLDKSFDQGNATDDLVKDRSALLKDLHDINSRLSFDMAQKAKIRWSIEGDENSKFFFRNVASQIKHSDKSKLNGKLAFPQVKTLVRQRNVWSFYFIYPFNYLGLRLMEVVSRSNSWDDIIAKVSSLRGSLSSSYRWSVLEGGIEEEHHSSSCGLKSRCVAV
ncbi:hypothetical protein Tco_1235745 [Tanacetum coccineum]